jgi:hypothetical protein
VWDFGRLSRAPRILLQRTNRKGHRTMTATATEALTCQMLEWIAARPRDYAEVMDTWRTSCPRLSIWEDACLAGLIAYDGSGRVVLSDAGQAYLRRSESPCIS